MHQFVESLRHQAQNARPTFKSAALLVADLIEPDSNLEKILNELREEYQLLDINFPGLDQFPKLEEYPTLEQLIEKYKDRINVLVY